MKRTLAVTWRRKFLKGALIALYVAAGAVAPVDLWHFNQLGHDSVSTLRMAPAFYCSDNHFSCDDRPYYKGRYASFVQLKYYPSDVITPNPLALSIFGWLRIVIIAVLGLLWNAILFACYLTLLPFVTNPVLWLGLVQLVRLGRFIYSLLPWESGASVAPPTPLDRVRSEKALGTAAVASATAAHRALGGGSLQTPPTFRD